MIQASFRGLQEDVHNTQSMSTEYVTIYLAINGEMYIFYKDRSFSAEDALAVLCHM